MCCVCDLEKTMNSIKQSSGAYCAYGSDGRPQAYAHAEPYRAGKGRQVCSARAEPGKKQIVVCSRIVGGPNAGNKSNRVYGGWSDWDFIAKVAFDQSRPLISEIPSQQLGEREYFEEHRMQYEVRLRALFSERRRLPSDSQPCELFVRTQLRDFKDRLMLSHGVEIQG